MTDTEIHLIDGKVVLRPEPDGRFDELLLMDGKDCLVHAEMMNDKLLWIGIYPRDQKRRRVCMWIGVKRGKLDVRAEEDS